jgi:hypothetical protein
MILQLPTLGGHVAGQVQAAEEVQRLERIREAQEYHRDTVRIVAALKDTVAINPVRPDPEGRARLKYSPNFRLREKKEPDPFLAPVNLVVDKII